MIVEYRQLTQKEDFTEADVGERDKQIHNKFIEYLRKKGLLKEWTHRLTGNQIAERIIAEASPLNLQTYCKATVNATCDSG